jgi:hypothetical protein
MHRLTTAAIIVLCAGCTSYFTPQFPTGGGGGSSLTGGGFGGGGGGVQFFDGGPFAGGSEGGGPGCFNGFDGAPPVTNASPPAISGGTMAVLSNGTIIVGDPDRDVLWVVENRGALVRRVDLVAGDQPGRIVAADADTAYVVLRRANEVAKLTASTGTLELMNTCHVPRALVWETATSSLLVGCADGTLERHTGAAVTTLALDAPLLDLRDLVADGTDLVATTFREARVVRISPTGHVTPLPIMGVPPDTEARVAWRLVPTASGPEVVMQLHRSSTIVVATNTCDAYGGGTTTTGPTTPLVTTARASVNAGNVNVAELLTDAVLPVDQASDSMGNWAVLSAGTNGVRLSNGLQVPLSGQPTAVALRDSQWVIFEREPAMLAFVSSAGTLDLELGLPGASVANTGHALFHTATHVGLACASCHPEAGDDGHVWNFDIGARRTQTLHGGLSGTAPFHWSGDEASMDNLVFDVMAGRMGGNQQTPERTAALLGWLDTQPVLEAPPTDPAAVARGAALFSSATCATCHTGALGTNNVTVDVGTGGMFQVPRLVELGWRNQWFHDGRIATASDRFAPSAGGDQHGVVSTLSAQDKADLIEYLRSR